MVAVIVIVSSIILNITAAEGPVHSRCTFYDEWPPSRVKDLSILYDKTPCKGCW